MSVFVIGVLKADPAEFERVHKARPDDFRSVANDAKAAGVMRHRFAFGDGTVTIIDEWPSAEAFEKFFDHPVVGSLMEDVGVAGPPEITILEAFESVDQIL